VADACCEQRKRRHLPQPELAEAIGD